MIQTVLIVIVIIILLTIIMFVLLKKIVKLINEQSKLFFVMKLQSYDELIDEKEKKLEKLENKEKEEILKKEELDIESINVVIPQESPKYEIEGLVEVIKKIEKEFNYDSKKIVLYYVELSKREDLFYYNNLLEIKNKLDQYGLFNIITKDENKQNKIFESLGITDTRIFSLYKFNYNTLNINNFMKVLQNEIKKNDPTIYVYVGDETENYNEIANNVKTCFEKTIIKGIKVKYKNILYEYSLS